MAGHGGAVSGMSLSGKLLITACFDHFIRCYDTEVYSQYVYIIMCILRMYVLFFFSDSDTATDVWEGSRLTFHSVQCQ